MDGRGGGVGVQSIKTTISICTVIMYSSIEDGIRIHGLTALHVAAKYGDYLIVSELIHTHHFCISSKDLYGRTPLHYAALYGKMKVASTLFLGLLLIVSSFCTRTTYCRNSAKQDAQCLCHFLEGNSLGGQG